MMPRLISYASEYTLAMRYPNDRDVLFRHAQLSDGLRAHNSVISQRVQAVAESVMRAVGDAELVEQLAQDLAIIPLRLDRERQKMQREEIQVDVTGDPRRMGFPDGRRLLIPGIRVTVSIPYVGDEQLWKLQPSTYRLSSPRGNVRAERGADRGVLDIVIEQPADEPLEQIKAELDRRVEEIGFFIDSQTRDLNGLDGQVRRHIAAALIDRRSRLAKHDGLSELLGIPETDSSSALPAPTSARQVAPQQTAMSSSEQSWDVFVSHASEDKDSFVRPLVAALVEAGLRVWYDEQELRVGDSLRRSIDRGLARSRFGIVVLSRSFLAKHWPQKELDGLVAREEDGNKVILPIWHDITAGEIRASSPTLADRLAISSNRGVEEVARELLRVITPRVADV